MEETVDRVIHHNKYSLQITYSVQNKKVEIIFNSKVNNWDVRKFIGKIPKKVIGENAFDFFRKVHRFRNLYIQLKNFTITLLQNKHKVKLEAFKAESEEKQIEEEERDRSLNYGVKYWATSWRSLRIKGVLDPIHHQIHLRILRKAQAIIIAEATIPENFFLQPFSPLKKNQPQEERLKNLFKFITQATAFYIHQQNKTLNTNHQQLNYIPLNDTFRIQQSKKREDQQNQGQSGQSSQKIRLFRHIFLTQVIAHMITNQMGRLKWKHVKDRDGYEQIEYIDEQFEELRKFGHRFSQFRDYPFKHKKKNQHKIKEEKEKFENQEDFYDDDEDYSEQQQEEQKSSSDESEKQANQKKISQKIQKHKKKQTKTTKLQKMSDKIKKIESLCNFTFISGREKSRINKARYCLHQMTRETDKTQALIDFVRLVFKVFPRKELVGKGRIKQKSKMAYFLNQFKVKREIKACLTEYTRQSFFHKILNIGLRIFKNPYELVYLRLPFSHLFWSIKSIYQRHKRVTFDSEAKSKKKITLYRGFEIGEKEIKRARKNIGGYIEIEGFLSTSLDSPNSSAFIVNAKMTIEIVGCNLRGMYDHGFASIRQFSEHPSEREVVVNAFNVFKILSVNSEVEDEMVVHSVRLEYGSMKQVEEKVQKSDNLLEAEYMEKLNLQELKRAKEALEANKNQLSSEMYEKLAKLLPKAEGQLKRRKIQLKKWAEEEYEHALSQLTQWQRELILNAKHQQEQMTAINNYGQLLFKIGEYRRASISCYRRFKQAELDKAVEGPLWRNSQSLKYKYYVQAEILYKCYQNIGRPADSLMIIQKLLEFHVSTNVGEWEEKYYSLLFAALVDCDDTMDKTDQKKRYKEKLMKILEKYSLKHTQEYQKMMKMEKREKRKQITKKKQECEQEEEKKKEKRKKKITSLKQELKDMRLFTFGKYSHEYLKVLAKVVGKLKKWQWGSGVEEAFQYVSIRNKCPGLQNRMITCLILKYLLEVCSQGRHRQLFRSVCHSLASYLPSVIYNYKELHLVIACMEECMRLQWWRESRAVVCKLMRVKMKCKMESNHVNYAALLGYVLLLLSVSEQPVVDRYLQWAESACEEHAQRYEITKFLRKENTTYNSSMKGVMDERRKDYHDGLIIRHAYQLLTHGSAHLHLYTMPTCPMPWQQPLHPYHPNIKHISDGIDRYMSTQLDMVVLYYNLYRGVVSSLPNPANTSDYLQRMYTLSKLHLNESHIMCVPSLLAFWTDVDEVQAVQVWDIGMDLVQLAGENASGVSKNKDRLLKLINHRKQALFEKRKSDHPEARRLRAVYARYQHYLLFSSNRRLRTTRYLMKQKKNNHHLKHQKL